MEQLALDIKREEEVDPWEFDNFDWLTGNSDNLILFFAKAMPRLQGMIEKDPQNKERLKKLKADCRKRLDALTTNSQNN